MKSVSNRFYFKSYLGSALVPTLGMILFLVAGHGKIDWDNPWLMLPALPGIYSLVVWWIFVHKMWKAIPANIARTTPAQAVGFLFIPAFNLYWQFQALWGWAKDWNTYAARSEGRVPRVSEVIPLFIAVIGAVSAIGVHFITQMNASELILASSVISLPKQLLISLFIFRICDVLDHAPVVPLEDRAVPRPLGVASFILSNLTIIPLLGLLCGGTAIFLAVKQRKTFREPMSTAGLIVGIIGTVGQAVAIICLVVYVLMGLARLPT